MPIHFKDRVLGESKIRLNDIIEFIQATFLLRFPILSYTKYILLSLITFVASLAILMFLRAFSAYEYLILIISIISILMTLQALFTLWWMLYAWDHPERVEKNKSPKVFHKPELSFTALVPAKNEEKVIGQTIAALSKIDYPEELKEIIVVCRNDDTKTIDKVRETINILGKKNIKLAIFNDFPINKPHALNIGLQEATKDVVVIFDAEDEPHKDILNIANTVMSKGDVDVLQSGVQLMNYRSTWFSTLNVLEYFFWFKSTLQFFASVGIIPLGGNTVFFKKDLLNSVNGWDESCLTEDADIGMRLSSAGAKIRIVYDEQHVTQEESPLTLSSFVKQRTRWSQGFIQILFKGQWLKLSSRTQRFLAGYILVSPELQALLFVYIAISLAVILFFKLPVWLVILSSLPFYILILQFITYSIGLYLFSKDYKLKFPFWLPLKVMFTFFPFQMVLGYSAARAVIRLVTGNHAWEKTQHVNAHRVPSFEIAA